ncbi:hypothetical protein ACJIZ3_014627 [Penstemon smallii]|uniref:Uncharacterized protein n=1 Tax=Penstemon smallii TaxID=265156 RepID=A0ABD3RKV9_9LAMI
MSHHLEINMCNDVHKTCLSRSKALTTAMASTTSEAASVLLSGASTSQTSATTDPPTTWKAIPGTNYQQYFQKNAYQYNYV